MRCDLGDWKAYWQQVISYDYTHGRRFSNLDGVTGSDSSTNKKIDSKCSYQREQAVRGEHLALSMAAEPIYSQYRNVSSKPCAHMLEHTSDVPRAS